MNRNLLPYIIPVGLTIIEVVGLFLQNLTLLSLGGIGLLSFVWSLAGTLILTRRSYDHD